MRPAYHIPLTVKELALLGELVAIIGLVDDGMIQVVAHFLKIDREAANVVMGSSKIGDNASIWAHVIRNFCADEDVLWLVEHASKEIQAVSAGRNDFVHAIFQYFEPLPMPIMLGAFQNGPPPTVARRVRRSNNRPVSELMAVRDQAARLSCLVQHIAYMATGNPANTSPWHERLSPSLPPRVDTVAIRKAKAQQPQQKSSRQSHPDRRPNPKKT